RAGAPAAGCGLALALPAAGAWLCVPITGTVPPLTVGAVNLPAFFTIVPMTILTAPLGAHLAHRLPPAPLRRVFGVFLCIVALNMLRAALWG
ncbi:MAG: TSUP family transporter, partial [Pseudomonadota bacterium]